MDMSSIVGIAKALEWFLTLGRSELRQVRADAEELLGDLRKSLVRSLGRGNRGYTARPKRAYNADVSTSL